MTIDQPALALGPGARSVQDARRWALAACRTIGREDLTDSAECGVAELVTNAYLHGAAPISLRVRGTVDHPRIEVADGSRRPPAPQPAMTAGDALMSTVGRGLGIVATCSRTWGADIALEGKIVWFEPVADTNERPDFTGHVFAADEAGGRATTVTGADGFLEICLQDLPVPLFVDFRRHFNELRRELRLLSLAHEAEYPVAKKLADLFRAFEEEQCASPVIEALERAAASGERRTDLVFAVPRGTPALMAQMLDLLELADAFCRSERLLAPATTGQQRAFQQWYLGEYVRQSRGEPPLAWPEPDLVAQGTP